MDEKRIVIDLPHDVWRSTCIAAATSGKTKKEFVADALRDKIVEVMA